MTAPFDDLLSNELADPERFRRVERRIHPTRPSSGGP
jgi:hypothetical protein